MQSNQRSTLPVGASEDGTTGSQLRPSFSLMYSPTRIEAG
jgi:hypothetical protein